MKSKEVTLKDKLTKIVCDIFILLCLLVIILLLMLLVMTFIMWNFTIYHGSKDSCFKYYYCWHNFLKENLYDFVLLNKLIPHISI